MVATTNSPDRRLTPAASSWASSFSPKPCALANRSPNDETLGDPAGPRLVDRGGGLLRHGAIAGHPRRHVPVRLDARGRPQQEPRGERRQRDERDDDRGIAWLEKNVSAASI